jgi:hypothetical protein
MHIDCRASRLLACSAERAFALACDASRFPEFFRGFGPIPAVRAIDAAAPPRTGAVRQVHNGDGSVLTETITSFEPPHRHAYRLSGFRAPSAWLVRHGDAEWQVAAADGGATVAWTYRFALTHPLAALPARGLLGFMTVAMRRCLDAMARDVALTPPRVVDRP